MTLSDTHWRITGSLGVATLVGEYWLQSTRSRASFAASVTNLGGLYPLSGHQKHVIQSMLGLRVAYSQEPLAHIDDWLYRRICGSVVDNGPSSEGQLGCDWIESSLYQTSCFMPATLGAGRYGSARTMLVVVNLAP